MEVFLLGGQVLDLYAKVTPLWTDLFRPATSPAPLLLTG